MNILIATDYFPPYVGGGVEQVTYHMAEELTKLGHHVAVLTLNTCSARPTEDLDGIQIYRAKTIEFTNSIGLQSAISTKIGKLIREVCRSERAEMLHANNLYFYTTVAACHNLKALRLPLVTTLHLGSISELQGIARYAASFYEKSIGRWILSKSSRIVAVSHAVKEYAETLGVNPRKVSVVPNGVDILQFQPSSAEDKHDGEVRVGFIGRLIANKGPQYLVEAAPRIIREFPDVRFQVAGDGPMLHDLQHRVRELGVQTAFRFLGTVPSNVEFLQSCDIVVRPSLTDGMPLAVLEAMACGKPSVASRVGGTPEILQDGDTGYLVEPRNVEQLVSKVSKLLADPDLRVKMGNRARNFAEGYYSWEEIARQMTKVYENALLN